MHIKNILEDIKKGKPIIVVDDKDRENEGDLVIAAEKASASNLAFCIKNGGGLMCLPCTADRLDHFNIPMMPSNGLDPLQTPFALSIDAVSGTSTGMSVQDRLKTISVFLDKSAEPQDLHYPGHLFPLRARDGLLKERRGHTESSIELIKLAKLQPVSVIVEIMNEDGSMKKGDQMLAFAEEHDLKIISVEEIYNEVYNKGL